MSGANARARTEYQRALALEPERPITLVSYALERSLAGSNDEALALADSALSIDPSFSFAYARRSLYRLATDVTGARTDAETAIRLRTAEYAVEAEAALAAAEFRGGDTAVARARLQALLRSSGMLGQQAAYFTATALAITGDRDGAIHVLEGVVPRGAVLWSLMRDPWFDRLDSAVCGARIFHAHCRCLAWFATHEGSRGNPRPLCVL